MIRVTWGGVNCSAQVGFLRSPRSPWLGLSRLGFSRRSVFMDLNTVTEVIRRPSEWPGTDWHEGESRRRHPVLRRSGDPAGGEQRQPGAGSAGHRGGHAPRRPEPGRGLPGVAASHGPGGEQVRGVPRDRALPPRQGVPGGMDDPVPVRQRRAPGHLADVTRAAEGPGGGREVQRLRAAYDRQLLRQLVRLRGQRRGRTAAALRDEDLPRRPGRPLPDRRTAVAPCPRRTCRSGSPCWWATCCRVSS